MGAFTSHLVGFFGEPEAEEFFAEIALVEFVAEHRFVGRLHFGKCEISWEERVDCIRVRKF